MRSSSFIEPAIIAAVVLGLAGLFVYTYFNFVEVRQSAWQISTKRVMDSMQPFQSKYHQQNGRYAVGIYDGIQNVHELKTKIGWKPSLTDQNRYVVHIVGKNAYKVIVSSPAGDTVCRIYPARIDCFDLGAYHQSGI